MVTPLEERAKKVFNFLGNCGNFVIGVGVYTAIITTPYALMRAIEDSEATTQENTQKQQIEQRQEINSLEAITTPSDYTNHF